MQLGVTSLQIFQKILTITRRLDDFPEKDNLQMVRAGPDPKLMKSVAMQT